MNQQDSLNSRDWCMWWKCRRFRWYYFSWLSLYMLSMNCIYSI